MDSIYAVVDNGVVINIVIWDGESKWKPESGVAILAEDSVSIGWLYRDGYFSQPEIILSD
ncbi:TPA: hypothetical protein ACHBVO_003222 [Klebsiella pneumoniae]